MDGFPATKASIFLHRFPSHKKDVQTHPEAQMSEALLHPEGPAGLSRLSRLRKIKVLLKETWSEVDSLTADAAMLSAMFRQQAAESSGSCSCLEITSTILKTLEHN